MSLRLHIVWGLFILLSMLVLSAGCGSNGGGGGGGPTCSITLEAHRADPGNSEVKVITITAYLSDKSGALTGKSIDWTTDLGTLSGETEDGGGYYSVTMTLPSTGGEATVTASYCVATASITVIGADYLATEWDVPIALTSINTDGWEDTPYIAPDGQTLYFSYAGFDINTLLSDLVDCLAANAPDPCPDGSLTFQTAGPDRPGSHGWYNFDVYRAERSGANAWNVVNSSVNNYIYNSPFAPAFDDALMSNYPTGATAYSHEASPFVTDDGSTMLTMMMTETGAFLFYSIWNSTDGVWGKSNPLPAEVNSGGESDNGHVVSTGATDYLYFNSGGVGCGSPPCDSDLFLSTIINGTFSDPTTHTLFQNVNDGTADDIQPFVTSDMLELYFASDRGPSMEIYNSVRANTGSNFAAPTKLFSAYQFAGVGDPSVTADGSEMFFVYVKANDTLDGFNSQLGYIKKR